MKTQVGTCPKCGAPIYVPTAWWGVNPPPNEYTCGCFGQTGIIKTTNTTGTTQTKTDKQTERMKIQKEPTCVNLTFCPASYWLRKCDDSFLGDYMLTHRIDMSYAGKVDQEGSPVLYLSSDEAKVFREAGFSEIM